METMASQAHVGGGFRSRFWDSFQREFLNLMSFGYLDDGDDAGVFALAGGGTVASAVGETATPAAAAGRVVKEDMTGASRGVGNVFTYVTSPWAITYLFMAVVLNRTTIYASLRRPLCLPFKIRLLMRLVPIILGFYNVHGLVLAMRCQSSGLYKNSATSGGLLWQVGYAGTWWMDDNQVCQAAGMIPDEAWVDNVAEWGGLMPPEDAGEDIKELPPPKGSLELLWPLYKTLCLSQLIEAFACAITGRNPAVETGMTLLEHSVAFAEAEAQAKRKPFVIRSVITEEEEGGGEAEVTKPEEKGEEIKEEKKEEEKKEEEKKEEEKKEEEQIVKVYSDKSVTPEVLYIGLISALGHLTSHILGVFGLQSRYRLLSTGFFGIAFFCGFAWALNRGGSSGLLEFPTVCVVGFIPHLLIFTAISFCAVIYTLALVLSSLFPPPPFPARPSFKIGFENLRANLTLSSVTIDMAEDFYTTLLKLGYMCLAAASEATYLNEGRSVRVPTWTWLESQKAKVLESQRRMGVGMTSMPEAGMVESGKGKGPYAKEWKDVKGLIGVQKAANVGMWVGAAEMMRGVGVVLVRCTSSWMWRAFGRRGDEAGVAAEQQISEELFENEQEAEEGDEGSALYNRFLRGGPWGETDESGDYAPDDVSITDDDNDRATVVSESEWESESECPSGQTTPTQQFPYRRQNHLNHPPSFGEIFNTPLELASLLDPQTPEQREQARVMARHLTSSQILTRSGYERTLGADRALLYPGLNEERTLESILLHQRREMNGGRNLEGKEVEGDEGGPQCVVCQSAQRTILVWPCRCLALCEDCRVCLALNNFANCVTCRSPLEGFSRIYIP